jgi:hypothetical protein
MNFNRYLEIISEELGNDKNRMVEAKLEIFDQFVRGQDLSEEQVRIYAKIHAMTAYEEYESGRIKGLEEGIIVPRTDCDNSV